MMEIPKRKKQRRRKKRNEGGKLYNSLYLRNRENSVCTIMVIFFL